MLGLSGLINGDKETLDPPLAACRPAGTPATGKKKQVRGKVKRSKSRQGSPTERRSQQRAGWGLSAQLPGRCPRALLQRSCGEKTLPGPLVDIQDFSLGFEGGTHGGWDGKVTRPRDNPLEVNWLVGKVVSRASKPART